MERIANKKKQIVSEVGTACKGSEAVFFLDIKNVPVSSERRLRVDLRAEQSTMQVVKARLARIALREFGVTETDALPLEKVAAGQLAMVFSKVDSQNVAKKLCSYQRVLEKDVFVLGGVYKSRVLSPSDVVTISKYPSKAVAIQRLAFALSYPVVGLARTLKEVAEKN